jgi:hypothetical protein
MHHQENIKNAQHSKVGRVNLGARIAPKASRKCQDCFVASLPRIYRERMRLPKQAEKASLVDAETCLGSKLRSR